MAGRTKTLKGVGLQELIISYLEGRGWYFDWEHAQDVWDADSREALLKSWPDAIRTLHAWTVPQWGEYWMDPRDPEKEKKRRYEDMRSALWSQLLREEEPDKFECFFEVAT